MRAGLLTLWLQALSRGDTWRRGLWIGLVAGSLQVAVNQGDLWWRGAVDGRVVMKTVLSPMIALGLAVAAAAWGEVARRQKSAEWANASMPNPEQELVQS